MSMTLSNSKTSKDGQILLCFPGEHSSAIVCILKGHLSQNETVFLSFQASLGGEMNIHPKKSSELLSADCQMAWK